MDLLKASYTGSLGSTTGAKWKNKAVIKAKIWSKAPPTASQTASVRAFECLNRLASAIAKAGFKQLPLSARKMLPHNAVAQWLKPTIKNKVWEPQNISEVIPYSDLIQFQVLRINKETSTGTVKLGYKSQPQELIGSLLFIAVFGDNGYIADCRLVPMFTEKYTFPLPEPTFNTYSAIGFLSTPAGKTNKISNFIYKERQGMKYSEEEQATGNLWLDGRMIYQRTMKYNIPDLAPGLRKSRTVQLGQSVTLIKMERYIKYGTGEGTSWLEGWAGTPLSGVDLEGVILSFVLDQQSGTGSVILRATQNARMSNPPIAYDITLTLYYTKTNEDPLE